ncbi:Cys-tRNA(Pro) deacylase [Rothia uropygioeca]|uniref:Cys-tRNA(Pro) deacylase n=1 Tax=Kocuria sp. 257 TaxID=2021970 RepID=UPI00101344E1|nr:Cys-tRNA(Pro) deacylase [Kocuria sp. 257]
MSRKRNSPSTGSAPTAAIAALQEAGVAFELHPYDHDDAAESFGAEAAEKLGREAGQVFKTLMITHDKEFAVAVVPVSGRLNLKHAAAAMGWKSASLADPAVAEKRSGYVVGGISPLGHKTPVTVLLDKSAALCPTVLVSGGKRGLDVELSPADLLGATDGRYADIGAN